MADFNPFPDATRRPRTWTWNAVDGDDTIHRVTVEPEDIALYAHCGCGMSPMEFVAWLTDQLVTLDAIDPECGK